MTISPNLERSPPGPLGQDAASVTPAGAASEPSNAVVCRASGFGGLFDCAMRWEGVHILGMRSPASARSLLGTGWHAGTAAFDSARVAQSPITVDDAAEATVRAIADGAEEVPWTSDDLSRREIEAKALTLHALYCNDVSPTFEFESVELKLVPLDIDCGNGVVIRLTGSMDRARVRKASGKRGIDDLKSGARAIVHGRAVVGRHRPQLGVYELLYEHTTGLRCEAPAGIIAASTGSKPEIAVGEATSSCRDLMVGTDSQRGLLEYGADMLKAGSFPPNPASVLCDRKYCPRWDSCAYRRAD